MGGEWAPPRILVVTRRSELERLVARHGTRGQAQFFLARQGQSLDALEHEQRARDTAVRTVEQQLPSRWRRARVDREDLSRWVFEPDDVIVPVGQDGLVANCAKYLAGQPVIGVHPEGAKHHGALTRHAAETVGALIHAVVERRAHVEARTMVEARLDDGQRLLGLNELFLGHRTHQSARYTLRWRGASERQSSSGLVVTTGTGAGGWALSIARRRASSLPLPEAEAPALAWFVREAWPSAWTGAELCEGALPEGEELTVVSEMNEDGVLFGDGIEDDRVPFLYGRCATLRVADARLRLVVG